MILKFLKLSCIVFSFLLLTGWTAAGEAEMNISVESDESLNGQPLSERKAQEALPMSKDKIWDILMLSQISMNENEGTYQVTIHEDVKKLTGQKVKMSGFMMPLESTEKFHHFLLSKRTPTCAFCPPGQPNELVDVMLTGDSTDWKDGLITVEGIFSLINDQELGVFYKISDGKIK